MKNENLESRSWDDLVFENRNHEYGAYVIRKSYSDNLLSGTFVSVFLAALVLLAPLLSSFKGKETGVPIPERTEPTVLTDQPLIEIDRPPVAPPPPPAAANINLPPRVTTDSTYVVVPTNNQIMTALPSSNGVEGGVPSPTPGNDIVAPPAVVEPTEFTIVEEMPEFEGGMAAMYQFIQRKMKYPAVPR